MIMLNATGLSKYLRQVILIARSKLLQAEYLCSLQVPWSKTVGFSVMALGVKASGGS